MGQTLLDRNRTGSGDPAGKPGSAFASPSWPSASRDSSSTLSSATEGSAVTTESSYPMGQVKSIGVVGTRMATADPSGKDIFLPSCFLAIQETAASKRSRQCWFHHPCMQSAALDAGVHQIPKSSSRPRRRGHGSRLHTEVSAPGKHPRSKRNARLPRNCPTKLRWPDRRSVRSKESRFLPAKMLVVK